MIMNHIGGKEPQPLPREAQGGAKLRRNRRFSLALLSIFLIAALFGLYHLPSRAATGTGTPDDPILIATSQDLIDFRDNVNSGNVNLHAKLTADIDLEGTASNKWTPIGQGKGGPFFGTFDGQGHTISGLYINTDDNDYQGLFGQIGDWNNTTAVVKNLTVSGDVTGRRYVALIVGWNQNGKITNCTANGNVTGKFTVNSYPIFDIYGMVGGVVGGNDANANGGIAAVSNCVSNVTISSTGTGLNWGRIGGVVGSSQASGNATATVSNCVANGSVTATGNNIGGIVGLNEALGSGIATVSNCAAKGTIVSGAINTGGVVGWNNVESDGGTKATVKDCASQYNTISGDITNTGGVVGLNTKGTVTNCGWLNTVVNGIGSNNEGISADIVSYDASAQIVVACLPDPKSLTLNTSPDVTGTTKLITYPSASASFGTHITSVDATLVPSSPDIAAFAISGNEITVTAHRAGAAEIMTSFHITPTWFNGSCNETSPDAYSADLSPAAFLTISGQTAPKITTGALPNSEWNVSYSHTLSATGATPITWSVSNGDLPAGLSLNATSGVISGTPTSCDTYEFVIKAENGIGSDSKQLTITITPKDASTLTIAVIADQTYTGDVITPELEVMDGETTLTQGTHYTVAYTNNTNAGTATATVTGIGNYTGAKSADFTIKPRAVTFIIAAIPEQTFTGSAITPVLKVSDGAKQLTQDTHYTVAYKNNTKAGTATATVTGIGNYAGSSGSATFVIKGGSPDPDPKPIPEPVDPITYHEIEQVDALLNIGVDNLRYDPVTNEVMVTDAFAQGAISNAGIVGTQSKVLPIATTYLGVLSDVAALRFTVKGNELGAAKIENVQPVKIMADGTGEKFKMATKKEDIADKTAAVYEDASADIFASGDIEYARDYYLVVYILDGGSFDLDGEKNGTVTDPVALVKASQPKPSSSGGCNAGLGALAVLALIPVVLRRKRK